MRKHIVLVAGLMLCCSQAGAQVEPRVAGDWKIPESAGQPAKVLHIGGDGHYQLTSAGQVADSGRITASEGAVKLQSESGKQEQSRFSMIGGELKMHGGSIDGSWVRNGMSPQTSASHQYTATPSITPSSGNTSHFSNGGSSSSQAIPPSKAIWGSVSETHTSTPSSSPSSISNPSSAWSGISATPSSSPPANSSFSSISATPKSGSSSGISSNAPAPESSAWNSISATGSSSAATSTNSTTPAHTGSLSAQSGQQSGQLKSTGNKIFNFVKNNFNAATEAASTFSPGVTQTNGYSSSPSPSNNYNGYGASNSARANAFITPSAAQRYYGSGGMPKRSTSDGIPVMKDGTARKIRFGR